MTDDLFPSDTARERIVALIERRAAEAMLEIAISAKRARLSISQQHRRYLERMAVRKLPT